MTDEKESIRQNLGEEEHDGPAEGHRERKEARLAWRMRREAYSEDGQGGEGSLRLNHCPLANDLVSHDYVKKPP